MPSVSWYAERRGVAALLRVARGRPHLRRCAAPSWQARPVRVVYSECVPSLDCALRRERQLKRWSGEKTQRLPTAGHEPSCDAKPPPNRLS